MKKIVTHGVNFHNDDLFATAVVMLMLDSIGEKYKFTRVKDFNPKSWQDADYVYDIGRIYDPKRNRFDHHQEGGAGERENGIPYASFGLVWKKFGKKLSGSQEVADYVDRKLVQPIDAEDNGVELYEKLKFEKVGPFVFQDYIYLLSEKASNAYEEGNVKAFDKMFNKLLPVVKELILTLIEKGKYKAVARKKAEALMKKAKDKRVIIMNEFVGFDFSDFPEPLVTIYPDRRRKGSWCAKTVKKEDRKDSFQARMYFPKEWAGKSEDEFAAISGVPDAYFCHNARFLMVAKSKEGILALVKKALSVL